MRLSKAVTYFMELGFMSLTVRVLRQNEYVMKLIAQVFILVINYLFSKLFTDTAVVIPPTIIYRSALSWRL